MNGYYLQVLEVSRDCAFAFFECSNGDFGFLEPLNCEVNVGDILREENNRNKPRCGQVEFIINGRVKGKVHIDSYDLKENAYRDYKQWAK